MHECNRILVQLTGNVKKQILQSYVLLTVTAIPWGFGAEVCRWCINSEYMHDSVWKQLLYAKHWNKLVSGK